MLYRSLSEQLFQRADEDHPFGAAALEDQINRLHGLPPQDYLAPGLHSVWQFQHRRR